MGLVVAAIVPWPSDRGEREPVAAVMAVSRSVSANSGETEIGAVRGNSAHRPIETLKVGERVLTGLASDTAGETMGGRERVTRSVLRVVHQHLGPCCLL